jgi:hypothetical protein
MKTRATLLALVLALGIAALLAAPFSASAGTTQYNPRRAGHPLRIIAYAAHPFGVLLDYAIFRPAWWLGTHEPLRTIFGVQVVVDDSAEVAREVQQDFQKSAPLAPPETPDLPPGSEPPPQD